MAFRFFQTAQGSDAVAQLRESGVLVLPVAQNDPRLDISFHLASGEITDESLAPLAALAADGVYQINLRGTKITDAGLQQLKTLTGLERLHLEQTAVTDAGLDTLTPLQKLNYLNLYGSEGVTDAAVPHLSKLAGLKKLFLWQTKVTKAGAEELKKALPEAQINLGVDADKDDDQQDGDNSDAANKAGGR